MKGAAPRVMSRRKPDAYRCPVCKDTLPSNLDELEAEANRHRVAHILEGVA